MLLAFSGRGWGLRLSEGRGALIAAYLAIPLAINSAIPFAAAPPPPSAAPTAPPAPTIRIAAVGTRPAWLMARAGNRLGLLVHACDNLTRRLESGGHRCAGAMIVAIGNAMGWFAISLARSLPWPIAAMAVTPTPASAPAATAFAIDVIATAARTMVMIAGPRFDRGFGGDYIPRFLFFCTTGAGGASPGAKAFSRSMRKSGGTRESSAAR